MFGTVVPVLVSADDTVRVTNAVHSSANSGGQNGANGMAGPDGKDGVDGQSGQAGSSGQSGRSVIQGDSTATIKVDTVIDGETITRISTATSGGGSVDFSSDETNMPLISNDVTSSTTGATGTVSTAVASTATSPTSTMQQLITALEQLFEYYVNLLF